MSVFYNEIDRHKAAWLRHLIEEGEIAHGVVDERSIHEVQPEDLRGFAQCHFFAGVGVHSYALRRAGWPDDRPIWSGSCPCGPFSTAGLQKGFADPRHLWPEWFRLISVCRPDCILGEQVDAADLWIDLVSTDLEGIHYAIGTPDLPAAGFGGAHERQRFIWMADANNTEWWSERAPWHDGFWPKTGRVQGDSDAGERGASGRLGHAYSQSREWDARSLRGKEASLDGTRFAIHGIDRERPSNAGDAVGLAQPDSIRLERRATARGEVATLRWPVEERPPRLSGSADTDWLYCRDGRWRPVEPRLSPLVDPFAARVDLLRGYGDAIDAEALTQFVAAYLDVEPGPQPAHLATQRMEAA